MGLFAYDFPYVVELGLVCLSRAQKKKKSKEGREDGPGHTPGAKKYSGGFTPRSPTSPSPSPPSRRSAESFF